MTWCVINQEVSCFNSNIVQSLFVHKTNSWYKKISIGHWEWRQLLWTKHTNNAATTWYWEQSWFKNFNYFTEIDELLFGLGWKCATPGNKTASSSSSPWFIQNFVEEQKQNASIPMNDKLIQISKKNWHKFINCKTYINMRHSQVPGWSRVRFWIRFSEIL